MQIKNKYNVAPEFESLFDLSPKNQLEVEVLLLTSKFLEHITNELQERKMTKKELAQLIGVSASWLTQIFRGDKVPNWETIVKIQNVLNLDFEINLKSQSNTIKFSSENFFNRPATNLPDYKIGFTGFFKNNHPDYNDNYLDFDDSDLTPYPMTA